MDSQTKKIIYLITGVTECIKLLEEDKLEEITIDGSDWQIGDLLVVIDWYDFYVEYELYYEVYCITKIGTVRKDENGLWTSVVKLVEMTDSQKELLDQECYNGILDLQDYRVKSFTGKLGDKVFRTDYFISPINSAGSLTVYHWLSLSLRHLVR